MLHNKGYRIRLAGDEDIDFITDLRLSQRVQSSVGVFLFTNTANQKEWLQRVSKSSNEKFMIFELFEDISKSYKKIGMVRFSNIDFVNRSVCVGGDIAEIFEGKGHGKAMYETIFKVGFDVWGMNRMWLSVLENNERAIALYKKMGFIDEGVQREAIYKDDKYLNYINMSVLRNEYNLTKR